MNYYQQTCGLSESDFIEGIFSLTDQEVSEAHASLHQNGDLVRAHHIYILMCARLNPDFIEPGDPEPDPMMRAYHAWLERSTNPNLIEALSVKYVTTVVRKANE